MVENLTKIILIGVSILFTVVLIRIVYYHMDVMTDVMKQDAAISTARVKEEVLSDLYDMTTHRLIGTEVVNAIRRYDEAGYGIYITATDAGNDAVVIDGVPATVYKAIPSMISIEAADNGRSFYVNPSAYYTCYVGRVSGGMFTPEPDYSFVSDLAFVQVPAIQQQPPDLSLIGQWWNGLSAESQSALYDAFVGGAVESKLADFQAALDKVGKVQDNPDYFVETYELSVGGDSSSEQSSVILKDLPAYIIAFGGNVQQSVYQCTSFAAYKATVQGALAVVESNEVYRLELNSGNTKIIIIY